MIRQILLVIFFLSSIADLLAQSSIEPSFSADDSKVTLDGVTYQVSQLDEGTVKFLKTIVNNKADLFNNQGVDAFHAKSYADAIRYFDQALKVRPKFHEAVMNKAATYIAQASYDKAIGIYDKLLEEGNEAGYWVLKGQVELKRENFKNAITDFNEAIKLDENNSKTIHAIANAYLQTGDLEKAIEHYTKAIEMEKLPAYYNDRGNVRLLQKKYREAIQDYEAAIKLFPKNYRAYSNKGKAHFELQEYKKAAKDFEKAISLNPNYSPARLNLAANKNFQKDFVGAVVECTKVIKNDPENSLGYLNRGIVKHRLGDKNGACLDWKKAKKLGNTQAAEQLEKHCTQ